MKDLNRSNTSFIWPFANMRIGETQDFEIITKSRVRGLLRSALCGVKRRKGFHFRVAYCGRKIAVTRTE